MTTEQPVDLKVLARIKKLHDHALSAKDIGSLAEADTFMEAVEKMLAANNLDMSALSLELRDLQDPLGRDMVKGIGNDPRMSRHAGSKPVEWVVDLAIAVADAHFCASNYGVKSTYVYFYGRESNRKTAVNMFEYLRDMAERLAWDAYVTEVKRRRKENGTERGAGEWRLAWLQGYVDEVSSRYRAMRVRLDADRSMALVLVSVKREAEQFSKEDAGSIWSRTVVPDQPGMERPWIGRKLRHFSTDILKQILEAVRDAEWPEPKERRTFIDAIRHTIRDRKEDTGMLESGSNYDAREAGQEAGRSVNLRPNRMESTENNTRRLGSGT